MKPDFEDMVNRSGGNISERDAEILYDTAMEIHAKQILEIGARQGGSSMALGHVALETGGYVSCIEPIPHLEWYENIEALGLSGVVKLLEGASPWMPRALHTLEQVTPLDYLFLDGGGSKNIPHHTRWMIVDYHTWERFVRVGGRIAFHDWTGKNGVGDQVQRAVSIILETDDLVEVARHESTDRGIIVFEKRG